MDGWRRGRSSARLGRVKTLEGHVRKGHVVLDEPVELAEGTELEVRPLLPRFEDLSDAEQAKVEADIDRAEADVRQGKVVDALQHAEELLSREAEEAIEESYAQIARGEWVDGYELLDQLKAEAAADAAGDHPEGAFIAAHVRNGELVFEERVNLADGTRVRVSFDEVDDGYTGEERERLLRRIDESRRAIAGGDVSDAEEFLRQLEAET